MKPDHLGPYEIVRKLGRGGMGTVYEAVNVQNNEPAAVKLLNPHLADEEGFRERFEIEIETLKKLKHPNIVRLFGHGIHDGQLYYAMELVRGTNLEEELQAGRRFDWRETTRTGIRLCKALKHAHDHGVIHRDLKPANLLLTDEGEIKLTDFGIARLFGNTRLTADGGLIGTAEYMAPEQADGKQVTHHADLYSLGCVMFAMLAARPPFRGKSLPEMLQMQRLAEPPLVSRFAPDVPHELERIIVRLLSKNPSERPTNADLLARQLAAMEHGLSLPRRDSSHVDDSEEAGFSSTATARTVPDEGNLPPIEYDPNAPTRVAEPEFGEPPLRPRAIAHGKPQTVRGETGVDSGEADESPVAIVKPLPAGNRFVTVEEEEAHQRALERRRERGPVAVQIALLSASLLTLVALAWYFLRPPSADVLYDRIEAMANDEDPDLLMESAEDVESFLNRFPDDERARQVRLYREEIELLRLERRFSRRSRQLIRDADLLPIERDYIEAINQIGIDPQRTADELRALIHLYRHADASDERSKQVLILAMRQRGRLEQQSLAQSPAFLEIIDRNLERADRLKNAGGYSSEDMLGEALIIWRSIITLYSDKPWARERVERAREELRRAERGQSQTTKPE